MSELSDAAAKITEAAARSEVTTEFFDSVTTLGVDEYVTNTNNGLTVPSVQTQINDLYNDNATEITAAVEASETARDESVAAKGEAEAIKNSLAPLDSVADIPNITGYAVGDKIPWLGYHSASDGGSNWGVVKEGVHTADGGSIFTIGGDFYVEANLKGKKVSVKKFGATGDGITDDSASLMSWVDYVVDNERAGYANAGVYLLNEAVKKSFSDKAFSIFGDGIGVTVFKVPAENTEGGILLDATDRASQFTCENISIITSGSGNGTGLRFTTVEGGNQHQRSVIINQVEIKGETFETGYFDIFLDLSNTWRPLVKSSYTGGGFGSGISDDLSDDSLLFAAAAGMVLDGAYDPTIDKCHVWSASTAVRSIGTDQEAFRMTNTVINGCKIGLDYFRDDREPIIWLSGNHINYRDTGIKLDGAKLVHILDCHPYNEDVNNELGGTPIDMHLVNTEVVTISSNTFHFDGNPNRINVFVDATVKADTTTISNNTFNSEAVEAIRVGSGAVDTVIYGNQYTGLIGKEINDLSSLATIIKYSSNSVILESQADSNASGVNLIFKRDSETPASGDSLGSTSNQGNTDTGELVDFALERVRITDVANLSSSGEKQIFTRQDNSLAKQIAFGNGVQVGSPTGGYKGTGTINSEYAYYINGVVGFTGSAVSGDTLTIVGGLITNVS